MERIEEWLAGMKARANVAAAKCRENERLEMLEKKREYPIAWLERLKADPERYEKWREKQRGYRRKRGEEHTWWLEACREKRAAYWREYRVMARRLAHIFKGQG